MLEKINKVGGNVENTNALWTYLIKKDNISLINSSVSGVGIKVFKDFCWTKLCRIDS
jgi:hypothetical protein